MEGLLSIPLKKGSDIDVVKPLKNVIASLYSAPERQAEFTNSITEFNKLRAAAVAKQYEKSYSALEALYKYHDQIAAIELKIPSQDLQILFKWRDAFDKGGMFGGKVSLTVPSLGYEKVCILFNIAAMQSQLAAGSRVSDTDEELKGAARLFQSASGIFAQLRSAAGVMGGHEPTADMSPQALSVLSVLMLAQAQEVFVYKAIQDKMKDAIIAKLAMQAEDLYAETLHVMQKETKVFWDREWLSTIAGKQAAFVGLANYFQSNVCATKKQVGEQIARLNMCLEQLKQAQTRSGISNLFADYIGKATRSLAEAKKDNDFIYHERVPDSLPPVEKVATARLAKPTPVPAKFHSGRDLFEELMPVPAHIAMQACDMRKAEMVNLRVGQLRESSQFLNSVLASLNLPAAIDDQGSSNSVPQSLLEKSRAVQQQGGVSKLQASINDLPELVQRNKEILDEAERLLTEEEQSDEQLRAQLKEKWTRTASASLNATFKQNLSKYRTIITNALSADEIVKSKLAAHREAMEVLSAGESALVSKLPQSAAGQSAGGGPANAKENLKRLMREVETLKAEREDLESKLKTVTFDFKSQFLQALAQDGAINEPALSLELLGHGFATYDSAVKASLNKQQELVAEIQVNSDDYFGRQQSSDQVDASSREHIMRQLAEGFDAFSELQSNISEGTKFYNDLTQLLVTYQNKVSDYCFARKTEKEELLKDVTRTASASNATQPPPRPPAPIIPTTPYAGPAQPYPPAQPQQPAAPPQPAAPMQAQAPPAQPNPNWYGTYPPYPHYQAQGMPMPFQPQNTPYPFTPMPAGYNPYATYAPVPQQQPGQPQNFPYPVQPTMQQYPPPYAQQPPQH